MNLRALDAAELSAHSFGPFDIPHLGALCRQIREVRSISGASMAAWCGAPATRTITHDFEVNNQLGPAYFQRYLAALQAPELTRIPLSAAQVAMLAAWYGERNSSSLAARMRQLAAISFEDIHPGNPRRPEPLRRLVEQLEHETRPALIMDDLWHIHVLNDAILRHYAIAPDAAFLQRWEGWHTMAGKVPVDSPVRQAHDGDGQFIPPTLVYFYESSTTYPFFFTLQMRALLGAWLALSQAHQADHHTWWQQLTTFSLPYHTATLPRATRVHDATVFTAPAPVQSIVVQMPGTAHAVRYTLVAWDVLGSSNGEMPRTPHAAGAQHLYFAHDYDRQRSFHVNTWPDVQRLLRAWDIV